MDNKRKGEIRRIGILTSGGDCGGLNAVIKGAALTALGQGMDPVIIPNGYAGLYNLVDTDGPIELDRGKIDAIPAIRAGSVAGNSRVKIGKIRDPNKFDRIRSGLEKFRINALIISGGDDTGSVIIELVNQGIPCIHVPKTMDLDMCTYSVGGDSTVNRIANFLDELRTTGTSHNRVMVLEVFGRYTGHTAFRGGVAGGADCILIPEINVDFDMVYSHMKGVLFRRIRENEFHTGTYLIVVNEGLKDESGKEFADDSVSIDSFGHKKLGGSGRFVREQLSSRISRDPEIRSFFEASGIYVQDMNTRPEVRESVPGYLARSGYSSALDINFGQDLGAGAVWLLKSGIQGVTVTGMTDGKIHYWPVDKAIEQYRVDPRMVSVYEQMGICFGRHPVAMDPEPVLAGIPWQYLQPGIPSGELHGKKNTENNKFNP